MISHQQHDVHKNINKLKEYVKDLYGIKLVPDTTVPIPKAVESEMKYKPQKIEFNTPTELTNVDDKNYTVNIFNNPKRLNSKELINDEEDELLYTIKFDKETNKPIISLLHSTGKSDTSLIPTLKCLIVPNKENMDKPKIIINSHSKEEQFKLILDTGSNVSLINKRLISKEMKNHVHKTKAKINFPLLDVKEEFVEQINIQVNNEIHTFFIIELDIIDVLFGNDILKDSIINQKDKIIKLNNSTYKINYQQSNQLHCNIKAPRKHVTVSNDNKSESHNLLEDDEDIKEQVTKFVESIPSQICDILAKTNPEEEEINHQYHDTKYSGHHALDITYNNVRQDYYFKEMFSIIKRYIKSCATCQLNINRKDNGILQSLEIPFEVWRDISIDFLSLPKTTYALNGFTVEVDQVCVIVCRLSKMVHIVPCHKTIDAQHTAQLLLNHVFRLHGYPRTIVSDRDPRFLSDIWGRWAKMMDSKLKMTVAHRAQADGQTERMNREIKRILTKASTEYGENWSDIIPLIEFAMNSSMSKSTKMSPFQIVYGFNPPTPVNHFNSLTKTRIPMSNIKKIVRDNILDAQINAQKYYNRGRGDVIFVVGDKVMVKRKFFQTNLSKDLISHKLESKNCGPFMITAIHGNNVTLDLVGYPKKHNVFNKDQIVKLYEDSEWLREEISMPEPEVKDEASYEVESILNHDKVKKMYLVKFKEPEWIKEVDTDCEELVREYWNNVQKKQLNSRRERENATTEAIEPIVSSPLSQEVQNSQPLQPITPRQQNSNSNQRNQSKKRKSRNQNTPSDDDDDDDELDLSLQIKTTRSGRKVTPKRL
ncbi:hypothetical protein ACTFIW_003294 [Dictyostelium discoideum]